MLMSQQNQRIISFTAGSIIAMTWVWEEHHHNNLLNIQTIIDEAYHYEKWQPNTHRWQVHDPKHKPPHLDAICLLHGTTVSPLSIDKILAHALTMSENYQINKFFLSDQVNIE
jgi:hypothetical protein